jgi:hypothetical protein
VLGYIAPQFFAIHPVEHDAPEEDVLLLDLSFMSQSPEATLHVPGYAAWLEAQDHAPAYAYLRKLMKILLWQRGAASWVLKSPHHMEYIDVLLRTFPEARVVQTHRDPQRTMPSFCSMVAHGRGVFSNAVDPAEVARHWVRKVRRVLDRMATSRSRWEADRFIDVSYYDLVRDPLAQVERVYALAGLELSQARRAALQGTLGRNRQHKYGRHHYRLEDFGLREKDLEDAFGAYRAQFHIPFESELSHSR